MFDLFPICLTVMDSLSLFHGGPSDKQTTFIALSPFP